MTTQDPVNDIIDALDDRPADSGHEQEQRVDAAPPPELSSEQWLWRTCGAFLCV